MVASNVDRWLQLEASQSYQWGLPTDRPVAGDFDGDGQLDLVVYRPSDGGWYIRYSSAGYALNQWAYFQWGLSTDIPIAADFDGDGRSDLVVYRPSDGGWYVRYSSARLRLEPMGVFPVGPVHRHRRSRPTSTATAGLTWPSTVLRTAAGISGIPLRATP